KNGNTLDGVRVRHWRQRCLIGGEWRVDEVPVLVTRFVAVPSVRERALIRRRPVAAIGTIVVIRVVELDDVRPRCRNGKQCGGSQVDWQRGDVLVPLRDEWI